tara:strand:- start:5054 stop:5371 length:318 start_codon:yes stop_codon:yes gene_type:complete
MDINSVEKKIDQLLVKLRIKPVIGYLIEIDKLLIKHWKIIFFIAFLIPFTILLGETYTLRNLIYVGVDRSGNKSIGLGWEIIRLFEAFSPLIVLIVWKRLFHPND